MTFSKFVKYANYIVSLCGASAWPSVIVPQAFSLESDRYARNIKFGNGSLKNNTEVWLLSLSRLPYETVRQILLSHIRFCCIWLVQLKCILLSKILFLLSDTRFPLFTYHHHIFGSALRVFIAIIAYKILLILWLMGRWMLGLLLKTTHCCTNNYLNPTLYFPSALRIICSKMHLVTEKSAFERS